MGAGTFDLVEDVESLSRGRGGVGDAAAALGVAHGRVGSGVQQAGEQWTGPRSQVFDQAARGSIALLSRARSGCEAVEAALGDLVGDVRRAEDELRHLRHEYDALGIAAGGVDAVPGPLGDAPRRASALREHAAEVKRELHQRERAVAAQINAVSDRLMPGLSTLSAGDTSRRVTAALGGAASGHGLDGALHTLSGALLSGTDGTIDSLPGARATPEEVHDWWTGLSPAQRDGLLRTRPTHFGNLDGIPVLERDTANRIVLPRALASLEAEMSSRFPDGEPARMTSSHQGYDMGSTHTVSDAWTAWDDLQQRIDGARSISEHLSGAGEPPYFLIGFQPRVGNGRAIVSRGNPDTATNTSVMVPGTKARLGGIEEDIDRSRSMRRTAVLAGADADTLASVTWYGYDAPPTVAGHARKLGYAERGAPLLSGFANGLRATHHAGSRSHTSAVSHSYGTTVVGWAASHGRRLEVDDVAMLASPGSGVGHGWLKDDPTTVEDLHLSGGSRGHVFASRSRSDPIGWVADTHLGVDPTRPHFGATVFGATPTGGHGDYWAPHNPALRAVGAVIAGRGGSVPPPSAREDVHPAVDVSVAPGL